MLLIYHRAQWGLHPGGWGKPPLDEYNRPLYGDVFGVLLKASDTDVCLAIDYCSVEMEYCEMLFRLETERSDKELY